MAKKPSWLDRARAAFKSKDEAAMEEALKDAPTTDGDDEDEDDEKVKTGDAIAALTKAVAALDAKVTALATKDSDEEKKETEDGDDEDEDDGKTKDAAMMRFRDAVSRAEILAPGLRLPTTDAKASAKTIDAAVCQCQRRALVTAYATDAGKNAIDPFLAGAQPSFDAMGPAELNSIFVGASEILRARNNMAGVRAAAATTDFGKQPITPAALNAKHKAFWSGNATKN